MGAVASAIFLARLPGSSAPPSRPRRRTHHLRWLPGVFGALCLAALLLVGYVSFVTEDRRFVEPTLVPEERVALVFGAGVLPDGRPSRMLADRVDAAVELHRAGRVEKILMTGDNGRPDYDEVGVMRARALAAGVPPEDVRMDHAGFSTYESCYRARAVFGVERAVLVTQRYHLPRAVYTCGALGVEAVGFGTPDWGSYSDALLARYAAREAAATLNALLFVHALRPLPTYLGPFEPVV